MNNFPNEIIIDIMNRSFPIPRARFAATCNKMFSLFPFSKGLNTFSMRRSSRNLIKILESGDEDAVSFIDVKILSRHSGYVPKEMSFWGRPVTTAEVVSALVGFIGSDDGAIKLRRMSCFDETFFLYGMIMKHADITLYKPFDQMPRPFMILGIYLGCQKMFKPDLGAIIMSGCIGGHEVGDDLLAEQILIYNAFGFKEQTCKAINKSWGFPSSQTFRALLQYKTDPEIIELILSKRIYSSESIIANFTAYDKGKFLNQYLLRLTGGFEKNSSVSRHVNWGSEC